MTKDFKDKNFWLAAIIPVLTLLTLLGVIDPANYELIKGYLTEVIVNVFGLIASITSVILYMKSRKS